MDLSAGENVAYRASQLSPTVKFQSPQMERSYSLSGGSMRFSADSGLTHFPEMRTKQPAQPQRHQAPSTWEKAYASQGSDARRLQNRPQAFAKSPQAGGDSYLAVPDFKAVLWFALMTHQKQCCHREKAVLQATAMTATLRRRLPHTSCRMEAKLHLPHLQEATKRHGRLLQPYHRQIETLQGRTDAQ